MPIPDFPRGADVARASRRLWPGHPARAGARRESRSPGRGASRRLSPFCPAQGALPTSDSLRLRRAALRKQTTETSRAEALFWSAAAAVQKRLCSASEACTMVSANMDRPTGRQALCGRAAPFRAIPYPSFSPVEATPPRAAALSPPSFSVSEKPIPMWGSGSRGTRTAGLTCHGHPATARAWPGCHDTLPRPSWP